MTLLLSLVLGGMVVAAEPAGIAAEIIRAGTVITDTQIDPLADDPAAINTLIGREAKRTLYPGQKLGLADTRAPRLVTRNQVVTLKYISGALEIISTGRALGEAAAGEPVSVLNLASRQTLHGIVHQDGWVLIQ
jgi:flagellar basal body P-ring formation protein FlgA